MIHQHKRGGRASTGHCRVRRRQSHARHRRHGGDGAVGRAHVVSGCDVGRGRVMVVGWRRVVGTAAGGGGGSDGGGVG